jgi:hypothetical protein
MRRAPRKDANHRRVGERFRVLGFEMEDTSGVGNGFGDWLGASKRTGWTFMIEVKDGDKPPSARKLTPAEEKFHARWPGPLFIVETDADVDRVAALDRGGRPVPGARRSDSLG